MSKRLLLIVNPHSGRAKMKNELLRVTEIFSEADYDVTVYPTKDRNDATVKAASLKQDEYDILVVCGGDGTLNEVITGLMQSNIKINIGYIPSGTLNEWSSGLNIPRKIPEAAKSIVNGTETTLDIGKFDDKYFTYTASFGAFTEASYSAPQDIKNVLGQAAYFFEGIKSLGNIKPISLKFEIDDKIIEGDFLFGAISNSMSVGGIVKFDKTLVELNDGLFEIMLIRNPQNLIEFQSVVDGIIKKDLDREEIEFLHAKKIKVIGADNVAWTLDGEFCAGKNEIVIETIPKAITFMVPKED